MQDSIVPSIKYQTPLNCTRQCSLPPKILHRCIYVAPSIKHLSIVPNNFPLPLKIQFYVSWIQLYQVSSIKHLSIVPCHLKFSFMSLGFNCTKFQVSSTYLSIVPNNFALPPLLSNCINFASAPGATYLEREGSSNLTNTPIQM